MIETEHMDEDSTATATEQSERLTLPALDTFRAVRDLVALAVDPKAVKRNLRSLHDALAATAAAQRQLESDRAEHDAHIARTTAELADREKKLREGETALANKREWREDDLLERERRIGELEKAWRSLKLPGEDNFEAFGGLTRAPPPVSALQKARFFSKHGRLPHVDESLDAPVATEPQAGSPPAPVRRGHGDAGDWPANVSLTRTEEPPAGARIRGRRSADRPVTP